VEKCQSGKGADAREEEAKRSKKTAALDKVRVNTDLSYMAALKKAREEHIQNNSIYKKKK